MDEQVVEDEKCFLPTVQHVALLAPHSSFQVLMETFIKCSLLRCNHRILANGRTVFGRILRKTTDGRPGARIRTFARRSWQHPPTPLKNRTNLKKLVTSKVTARVVSAFGSHPVRKRRIIASRVVFTHQDAELEEAVFLCSGRHGFRGACVLPIHLVHACC